MSFAANDEHDDHQPLLDRAAGEILHREVRRDGRVIAVFRGIRADDGIVVETSVFPAAGPHNDENGIKRPFPFAAVEQARTFVDETLVALEYLGCTVR